jgi:hypothetical protein
MSTETTSNTVTLVDPAQIAEGMRRGRLERSAAFWDLVTVATLAARAFGERLAHGHRKVQAEGSNAVPC